MNSRPTNTDLTNAGQPLSATSDEVLPLRSCVGIMLLNREKKIWIGRRISKSHDDPNALIWQMPQGGIDEGEVPEVAALRELEEETGVTSARILKESAGWHTYELPKNLWGKALKGRFRGQTQKWFAMEFEGSEDEIDIGEKPTQKAEFDQWQWEVSDKLPGLIVPFKRKVYENVIEEFSSLLG